MSFATTRSGLQIDFRNPHPSQISFHDISLGLSKLCRFAGQCEGHYSVAQHSVLVALLLPPELRLEGLLHDGTEAYMGDLTTPLKALLPDYREVEAKVDTAIRIKAGLSPVPNPLVKEADQIALAIEARDLMPSSALDWPNVRAILENPRYQDDLQRSVQPIDNWSQAHTIYVSALRATAPKALFQDLDRKSKRLNSCH